MSDCIGEGRTETENLPLTDSEEFCEVGGDTVKRRETGWGVGLWGRGGGGTGTMGLGQQGQRVDNKVRRCLA